jgi:hypothetical protein
MCIFSPDVSAAQIIGVLFVYSLVASIFSTAFALLLGWPLSLLYRRLGLARWWQFCLGGVICAVPFWFAWFYPFNTGHWEAYGVHNSLYFYGVGFLGGYFYWRFVVRPQPTNKSNNFAPSGAGASPEQVDTSSKPE